MEKCHLTYSNTNLKLWKSLTKAAWCCLYTSRKGHASNCNVFAICMAFPPTQKKSSRKIRPHWKSCLIQQGFPLVEHRINLWHNPPNAFQHSRNAVFLHGCRDVVATPANQPTPVLDWDGHTYNTEGAWGSGVDAKCREMSVKWHH